MPGNFERLTENETSRTETSRTETSLSETSRLNRGAATTFIMQHDIYRVNFYTTQQNLSNEAYMKSDQFWISIDYFGTH